MLDIAHMLCYDVPSKRTGIDLECWMAQVEAVLIEHARARKQEDLQCAEAGAGELNTISIDTGH